MCDMHVMHVTDVSSLGQHFGTDVGRVCRFHCAEFQVRCGRVDETLVTLVAASPWVLLPPSHPLTLAVIPWATAGVCGTCCAPVVSTWSGGPSYHTPETAGVGEEVGEAEGPADGAELTPTWVPRDTSFGHSRRVTPQPYD